MNQHENAFEAGLSATSSANGPVRGRGDVLPSLLSGAVLASTAVGNDGARESVAPISGVQLRVERADDASDTTRFHRLLVDNLDSVTRYLSRSGIPAGEVDDAAQEVFLIASAKLQTIALGSERAFLFATAAHVAQNARRAIYRRARAHDRLVHVLDDPTPSLEELTDQLRARALLDEVLEQMPVELRGIFVLFEIEELSVAEIADRLALPTGTAASRLRRARESFRERITRIHAMSPKTVARYSGLSSAGLGAGLGSVRRVDTSVSTLLRPEIFSWWVSGGEVAALAALLDVYKQAYPEMAVVNAAVKGTSTAKQKLMSRMQQGLPPDTFQAQGGDDLLSWVKNPSHGGGKLDSLDFLAEKEGWDAVFPKDVVDVVSYGGSVYAVPVNIHRTNALFYNRRVLAESNLTPPTTFAAFHVAAATLRARGITPLALGAKQPWTLTLLAFENIMIGVAGSAYYRAFFSGQKSPDDPELRQTLVELSRVLDATNDDARLITWDQAAERVRTGEAAMTIMGDWTKGYLKSFGRELDEDFGEVPSPGTSGTFVFTLDTFSLPKGAPNRSHAIDLLRVFGSREGQNAFNRIKGSIPARTDVDISQFDALSQATVRDFKRDPHVPTITILAPGSFTRALDSAMGMFAKDRDVDSAIGAIRKSYTRLRG